MNKYQYQSHFRVHPTNSPLGGGEIHRPSILEGIHFITESGRRSPATGTRLIMSELDPKAAVGNKAPPPLPQEKGRDDYMELFTCTIRMDEDLSPYRRYPPHVS